MTERIENTKYSMDMLSGFLSELPRLLDTRSINKQTNKKNQKSFYIPVTIRNFLKMMFTVTPKISASQEYV